MSRVRLYLDDNLWTALHVHSRQSGLSISELVRQALRDRYFDRRLNRREAMQGIVGIWKDRSDMADSEGYVRRLRKHARPNRTVS